MFAHMNHTTTDEKLKTTDTHEPDGFLDPNCKFKKQNIETVIKCTTEELFKFTEYLEREYGRLPDFFMCSVLKTLEDSYLYVYIK